MKFCAYITILLLLSNCGGGSKDAGRDMNGEGLGVVKIAVSGSKSFNPNIDCGKITKYEVKIYAEDIAEPIIAEFDGDAESGVVEGVPVGANRIVEVVAYNNNEVVIRKGVQPDVRIDGGRIADIDIEMGSVPIFANLTDGSNIPNTRFIFKIFSDPNNSLELEKEYNGSNDLLVSLSNYPEGTWAEDAPGLLTYSPKILPAGKYKFTIKDPNTGYFSAVSVNLVDGVLNKPASFYSGGRVGQVNGAFTVARLGQTIASGNPDSGVLFPKIIEKIFQ